jgi:uncharacterized protein
MRLTVLDTRLAVCRLDAAGSLPAWFALAPPLTACVVRADELTLVCPEESVPADVRAERGWRALEVGGPMDLMMTGVMSSLSGTLADAGVSVFAVSSFDTDIILVRELQLAGAVGALREAGHSIEGD